MNYDYKEAVELLTSQGKFYINLGLDRISAFLELLGNPQNSLKYFHVAGTNGKGSVCAIIASVLQEAGKKQDFILLLIFLNTMKELKFFLLLQNAVMIFQTRILQDLCLRYVI